MKNNRYLFLSVLIIALSSCNSNQTSSIENNSEVESSSTMVESSSKVEESSSNERPSRPHAHTYEENKFDVNKKATLFESGLKTFYCDTCDYSYQEEYYDLDQLSYDDITYQYDGKTHTNHVNGLIPVGLHVEYENNSLTNIGSVYTKAKFIDNNNKIVAEKGALLTITDYVGFPSIKINTNNEPITSKEEYTTAFISTSNCESKYTLNNELAGIRLRGNGTLEAPKKPYRIKFDEKTNLLGISKGKTKSYVLLADYYDYSMLRNETAFYIANNLYNYSSLYSSNYKHVNVYLNNIYNGVYLLAEQQQVNKNRINIYEPSTNETNEKIGYLLELDQYAISEGDGYINVGNDSYSLGGAYLPIKPYSIKSDYYSNGQKEYISKYMNNVYTIMYKAIKNHEYYKLDENNNLVESSFTNTFDTVNNVIDVESLLKMYYIQEIMKNVDVGFSSFYMYVDFSDTSKHTRLTFDAPWDFDWSSGNTSDGNKAKTTGTYNNTSFDHTNPWLFIISKADFFNELFKKYYQIFDNSNIVDNALENIDYETVCFKEEFKKNFSKWNVLGTSQHGYHPSAVLSFTTHADASKHLYNWIKNRIEYLDSQYKEVS